MIYSSNMTAEETYRANGTLTKDQVEALLDAEDQLKKIGDVSGYISEAHQFPAEDFLADPISRLHDLAKKLRGDNRLVLGSIIKQLDDIAQCTLGASEYGRSELKKALEIVEQKR